MTTDGLRADGYDESRPLADKLNHLFAVVRRADGAEYYGKDVVAAVRDTGVELSASHLSELRRGIKSNPTVRVLQALADFFEVRVSYFFDDPAAVEQTEAELELRAAMRDARVQQMAHRAAGLSATQRAAFQRVLAEMVRDASQHPGDEPESASGEPKPK
jgi:transcriptional regulator with XRE-family HTH domain